MGRFNGKAATDLIVRCHRRCCVCHRFCGVKLELDHMTPAGEGGSDDIENAIPVCFECHAEIHSYNDQHPRGRKFQPDELRQHKVQWLDTCANHPEVLVALPNRAGVGPLQALIDELDFNLAVVDLSYRGRGHCDFLDEQFRRAVADGAISVLEPSLKKALNEAYVLVRNVNEMRGHRLDVNAATGGALEQLQAAKDALLRFLGSEGDGQRAGTTS